MGEFSNELELKDQCDMLLEYTEGFSITSDEEWKRAGNGLKKIKANEKLVKDFFEPMRKQSKAAYDAVIARRNEVMNPLLEAESILKGKMVGYETYKENIRREQEKALKAQAQAEVDRKFAEAAQLKAEGKIEQAEAKETEAEAIESVAATDIVPTNELSNTGIGRRKVWKIFSVDLSQVPNYVHGVLIRPVDEKAVMRLVKETDGTVEIPGIVFKKELSIVARS